MGYDSTNLAAAGENRSFPPFSAITGKSRNSVLGSFPPFIRTIRKCSPLPVFAALTLTACGTDQAHPTTPGEHVIYKTVNVEVPKPCPVTKPARPAKLARPLPTDPAALAEALVAKLLEWDGPGGYGDRTDAALDTCIVSTVRTANPK